MQRLIDDRMLNAKGTIYITASSKGKNHCQQGSINCIRTINVVYLQRNIWAWKGSFTYEHMKPVYHRILSLRGELRNKTPLCKHAANGNCELLG